MFEILLLFLLGLTVGLGGAVIPGPLLAFVIFDTVRKRKITGHKVIAGHVLWESFIILIILLGFGGLMMQYKPLVYIIGGGVLILTGLLLIRSRGNVKFNSSRIGSSLLGGVFYTAFNPTQPPWWASAGLALLFQGYEVAGNLGFAMVTVGHWFGDLAYYTFVSLIIHKYGYFFLPHQKHISLILGGFVSFLGLYFLFNGFLMV